MSDNVMVVVGDIIEKGQPIPACAIAVDDAAGDGWAPRPGSPGCWYLVRHDGKSYDSDTIQGDALSKNWGPLTVTAVREPEPDAEEYTGCEVGPDGGTCIVAAPLHRDRYHGGSTLGDVAVTLLRSAQQRALIGPPHAHQDGPCTDACYETKPSEPTCGSYGGTGLVHGSGANGNWTNERCGCDEEPSSEAVCHRCGGPNVVWAAPSPLWNVVMRGGSIGGQDKHDGIVCPTCFAVLAEEEDLAGRWRLYAESVTPDLETVTSDGRVWDDKVWLWVDPAERDVEDDVHYYISELRPRTTFCGIGIEDEVPMSTTDQPGKATCETCRAEADEDAIEPQPDATPSVLLDLVRQYGDHREHNQCAEDDCGNARALFDRIAALASQQPVQARDNHGDALWIHGCGHVAAINAVAEDIGGLIQHRDCTTGVDGSWHPLLVGGNPARPQDRHEPHIDGPREPTEQERADHDLMSALGVEYPHQVLPAIDMLKARVDHLRNWRSEHDKRERERDEARAKLAESEISVAAMRATIDTLYALLGVEGAGVEVAAAAIDALKAAQPDPSVLSLPQDGPSVFEVPQSPKGVTRVCDSQGQVWALKVDVLWHCDGSGWSPLPWHLLLADHGPLTDVPREPRTDLPCGHLIEPSRFEDKTGRMVLITIPSIQGGRGTDATTPLAWCAEGHGWLSLTADEFAELAYRDRAQMFALGAIACMLHEQHYPQGGQS